MTAVVAQRDLVGSSGTGRARRQVRVRVTATTAPDVRRAHPAAPSRRPAGVPAPTLRRGAMPSHLHPVLTQPSVSVAPSAPWRLTERAVGLIMAVVVVLMLTSLAVVGAKAVQVTSPTSSISVDR